MFTREDIANIGLAHIGSSQISRLDPARTSLERFIQSIYRQCLVSELTKRRWVFATEDEYDLPQVEGPETGLSRADGRNYKYTLPPSVLRPIRSKRSEWRQRGRFLYSCYPDLLIPCVLDVDESEFDPLFVEVLACRIAYSSAEFVTQSNKKKEDALAKYKDAVKEAGQVNAFIIGPEDIQADDAQFPFVSERY